MLIKYKLCQQEENPPQLSTRERELKGRFLLMRPHSLFIEGLGAKFQTFKGKIIRALLMWASTVRGKEILITAQDDVMMAIPSATHGVKSPGLTFHLMPELISNKNQKFSQQKQLI